MQDISLDNLYMAQQPELHYTLLQQHICLDVGLPTNDISLLTVNYEVDEKYRPFALYAVKRLPHQCHIICDEIHQKYEKNKTKVTITTEMFFDIKVLFKVLQRQDMHKCA